MTVSAKIRLARDQQELTIYLHLKEKTKQKKKQKIRWREKFFSRGALSILGLHFLSESKVCVYKKNSSGQYTPSRPGHKQGKEHGGTQGAAS